MDDKIIVLSSNVYKREGTKKYWYWIKIIRYTFSFKECVGWQSFFNFFV